jgi:hypothetical protein
MTTPDNRPYRFAFRFFDFFRFFGTLAPAARASDNPIAIACLRLVTLRPERPLFNVPAFFFFKASMKAEWDRAVVVATLAMAIIVCLWGIKILVMA